MNFVMNINKHINGRRRMDGTLTFTIDGIERPARSGQTVLEAAQTAGVSIPSLCHSPHLAPAGACP